MSKTIQKREASSDMMPVTIWEHIQTVWETEGSYAAVTELERIIGESDKLFLTNQIFTHCL